MKNSKFEKAFTLVELIVVMAIVAILSGVSIGAYYGIKNKADQSAFETNAKDAYDHYYTNLLTQQEYSDVTSTKASYTDGTRYMVYEDGGAKVELGTWDKTTNTFSDDTSKNFLMDVNSVGCRVVLKLNDNPSGTSKYRTTNTTDMIDADDVVFYPTLNQDGTVSFENSEDMWGAAVCYYPVKYNSAATAIDSSLAVTDTISLNNASYGLIFSKYLYSYAQNSTALFPDVLRSMYQLRNNDSLYLDGAKTKPWPRIISAQKSAKIFIDSGSNFSISFPKLSVKTYFGHSTFIEGYSDFVLTTSTPQPFFYNKTTPFSNMEQLTILNQTTSLSNVSLEIGYQDTKRDLTAFNNLKKLDFQNCGLFAMADNAFLGIAQGCSGPVFGDQSLAKAKTTDADGSMKHPLESIAISATKAFSVQITYPKAFSGLLSLKEVNINSADGALHLGS
ncbi:MAG: type II secretion system GspH family protein [Bacilli bacterium]|jgi:prepilin-type N-terminal cleavage/methylation domain-containing protein|nr:type II secretion system GspH family protein [Bacilli bacterium]